VGTSRLGAVVGSNTLAREETMNRDVLVLCYHAVSDRWRAPLSITPRALESQLEFLIRRGYRGATFRQAVLTPPGPKTLAVTFDDGYRSVKELARPILSRLGLPATVFVPTGFVGRGLMAWPGIDRWLSGEHEHELALMSWAELRALTEEGWEIGSHTRTHARLTSLDDAELRDELEGSRSDCEAHLGTGCRSLAYPYGEHDERVVRAAGRAGYEAAGTLPGRLHAPTPLRWPRLGVYHVDRGSRFRLKVLPASRWVRASRAADLATRLRGRPPVASRDR
jgi:peptidoglycan/xylan/chitin deacetylase (PgdA/CDA1 family)